MVKQKLNDEEFFKNLQHYTPLFYFGNGKPIFMISNRWYYSFMCIFIVSLLYIFCIYFFSHFTTFKKQQEFSPNKTYILVSINIFMLLGMISSYFMTQFLNPGIKNPSTLNQDEIKKIGLEYCFYCEINVLKTMRHCNYCKVCIQNKDHHCQFFERCMGGRIQQYGFKMFLLFSFLSCMSLFTTMILYLI